MNAALISVNTLNNKFHEYAEQLTGKNPAQQVQEGKRPNSKLAYILAYLKAFTDPQTSDTSDVRHLLGMLHLGILVAGNELDMQEVTGFPHGLYCCTSPFNARTGVVGLVFMGNGDQWVTAIRNGLRLEGAIREWSLACHNTLSTNGLGEFIGEVTQRNGTMILVD